MEFSPAKKIRFLTAFPLTSAEKKVLGFVGCLILLGAATLGFETLGGRFPEESFASALSRVPLRPQVYDSRARHAAGGFSNLSPALEVNQAGLDQLRWVPGIGPETARRIVQYREARGKFKTLEDLKKVSGVSLKKYNKMVPHLKVNANP
jgi:competence ComEA-like helix-hairpin-helix protein